MDLRGHVQLYNYTTIQLYNYTTIQPYNYTAIQLYKYTTHYRLYTCLSIHHSANGVWGEVRHEPEVTVPCTSTVTIITMSITMTITMITITITLRLLQEVTSLAADGVQREVRHGYVMKELLVIQYSYYDAISHNI